MLSCQLNQHGLHKKLNVIFELWISSIMWTVPQKNVHISHVKFQSCTIQDNVLLGMPMWWTDMVIIIIKRLLEDFCSSVLSVLHIQICSPKWAAKHGRIIRFYYHLPKGGTKGVCFKVSLYVHILWDDTSGTLVHNLMSKDANAMKDKYWSSYSLCI